MAVTKHLRITETTSVIDRRVVLAVIQDIIVLAADSGDNSQVCLESRRNGHTLLVACKFCDLFLQLQVQVERAVQETATAHAGSVFVERCVTGLNNGLVLCETEVVITAQHDHAVVLHLHHRGLTAFQLVEIRIDT